MSLPLEDKDIVTVEDTYGEQLSYEVVCIAEDDDNNKRAVCYCSQTDDFIVTDLQGTQVPQKEALQILEAFDQHISTEV